MKRIKWFIILLLLFPLYVYANESNVWYGSSKSTCLSYQDKSVSISDTISFSHCIQAKCLNNNYNLSYYSNDKVSCKNGNTSPYTKTINSSACDNYRSRVCNNGVVRYCTIVIQYDCTRTSSGADFKTTTKKTTKKVTKPVIKTTTTTTTTSAPVNTRLSNLTLSHGSINFSKDIYEYSVTVDYNVNSVDVTAIPEDSSSKVAVFNNQNLVDGSVINILVTGSDGSVSEYKINVNKEEAVILSSNAKLNTLSVVGYELNFNSDVMEYNIELQKEISELNIDYTLQDEKSSVIITGNENIKNGSVIDIIVKAEDGTEMNYKIIVNIVNKTSFIKILFIIVLIIALLVGGYYVYKKFMTSKIGEKYEYE